jgi:hypothetical protein
MRSLSLALPLLCAAGVDCSAQLASPTEPDAEMSSTTAAVVLVERTVSADESARAEAVARFVRMRSGAVDDDALRMVGAAIEFPTLGTCAALASTQPAASGPARAVQLVDVGTIGIDANGMHTALQARRLPDIVDLVSGVVYSTRAPDPDAFPEGAAYILHAAGRPEVDLAPFTASATAPREPDELRIAGQDPRTPGGLLLPSDTAATLAWRAGNHDDVVYVDVSQAAPPNANSATSNVRCLFEDAGHAVIAATALTSDDGTLTVHRLHRETFQAAGIDAGEIRFDFARTISFRR